MAETTKIEDLRGGDLFIYDGQTQIVVKSEKNIFGNYDVWYTRVDRRRLVPEGHLVLDPNTSLLTVQ